MRHELYISILKSHRIYCITWLTHWLSGIFYQMTSATRLKSLEMKFSKLRSMVILHSKSSSQMTFQNFHWMPSATLLGPILNSLYDVYRADFCHELYIQIRHELHIWSIWQSLSSILKNLARYASYCIQCPSSWLLSPSLYINASRTLHVNSPKFGSLRNVLYTMSIELTFVTNCTYRCVTNST